MLYGDDQAAAGKFMQSVQGLECKNRGPMAQSGDHPCKQRLPRPQCHGSRLTIQEHKMGWRERYRPGPDL